MGDDSLLLGLVFVVWAGLAIVYAAVPMFDMPGASLVWGAGAAGFLVVALIVAFAERRR